MYLENHQHVNDHKDVVTREAHSAYDMGILAHNECKKNNGRSYFGRNFNNSGC